MTPLPLPTPNIAAGDALMASLAPSLPTPLEAELSDKLAAAHRRIEGLELENEWLRAQTPDALNRARYPDRYAPVATRPLTTEDRLPEPGDIFTRPEGGFMVHHGHGEFEYPGGGFHRSLFMTKYDAFVYVSRADGGPVEVAR